MQGRSSHQAGEGKQEGEGLMDTIERHQLLVIANHASIHFYIDEHPHGFFLVAPHRSQKCGDCGLWMATLEDSLMCPRCGMEVLA